MDENCASMDEWSEKGIMLDDEKDQSFALAISPVSKALS
jgi:hypothetical protein